MKIRAIVANDKIDLDGETLSPECLWQLSNSALCVPITINSQPEAFVGVASGFRMQHGDLICDGDIDDISLDGLYPVIGFTHNGRENGEYINPKLFGIGLTPTPASVGTSIEYID